MDESTNPQAERSELERQVGALARAVRRQAVALWTLVAIIVLAYGAPWVLYWVRTSLHPDRGIPTSAAENAVPARIEEPWDNDFHARPPEEQVRRSTAILLTRLEIDGEHQRETVAEILKLKPGVRLYYKVGDEYSTFSEPQTSDCEGSEIQGSIVFMLGNPARMAFATTFSGDRISSLGDIPLEEIRRLAAESVSDSP